jgi:hypothetical protein
MSRQAEFMIYCAEQYRNIKNMTGRQVDELFTQYGVWEYIYSYFEALHTTGDTSIVNDIDLFIKNRQSVTA